MSKDVVKGFGYTMKEFSTVFLSTGFPPIYNDITDLEKIKEIYRRDIN